MEQLLADMSKVPLVVETIQKQRKNIRMWSRTLSALLLFFSSRITLSTAIPTNTPKPCSTYCSIPAILRVGDEELTQHRAQKQRVRPPSFPPHCKERHWSSKMLNVCGKSSRSTKLACVIFMGFLMGGFNSEE